MSKKHFRETVIFYQDDINEAEEFLMDTNVVYETWSNEGDYSKELRIYLEPLHESVFKKLKNRYPETKTKEGYLIIYE